MNAIPVRIWTFAAVLAVIAIVGLGWLLGASPLLAQAAQADSDRVLVDAQNQQAQVALDQLRAQAEQLPALQNELDALSAEFPSSAEYEAVIDVLVGDLGSAGLALQSLLISEPTVFDPEGTGIGEDGQIPIGTVIEIPVSVQVLGGATEMLAYVQSLQLSARFTVVDNISYSGGDAPSAAIQMRVYAITAENLSPGVPEEVPASDTPPAEGEESEEGEGAPEEG